MGELEYMGTVDVYGVRECMGVPFEYGGIVRVYGAGKPMKIKDGAAEYAPAPEFWGEPNSCITLLQMQVEKNRRVSYMQISNAVLQYLL